MTHPYITCSTIVTIFGTPWLIASLLPRLLIGVRRRHDNGATRNEKMREEREGRWWEALELLKVGI
jgi:uncharacterized membrane protein YhaH (DUF805 family)